MALVIPRQRTPVRTVKKTVPFNYAALLRNDPTLQASLLQLNQQGIANKAGLTGGYQQTLGRLGEAPDLASLPPALRASLQSAVTPELQGIIGQANQAGVSTLARLQHGYEQNQSRTLGNLAARGMLHSGALGQHSNENLHDYTLGQYDARQNALDSLNNLQSGYLGQQAGLAGQAGEAVSGAQQRIGQQIDAGLIAPQSVTRTVSNPYLNPAAPSQPYTRTNVGASTSYEPKPTSFGAPPKPRPVAAPYHAGTPRLRMGNL